MRPYIKPERILYEDGTISFPVIYATSTLWISQKEIMVLFEVDKIRLISMLKRVFRTIPKELHVHDFFIERELCTAQKQRNYKVYPIRHYDIECISLLQRFYPHTKAKEYVLTAQSYIEETT